jgi:hypothetical protein
MEERGTIEGFSLIVCRVRVTENPHKDLALMRIESVDFSC